MRNGLFATMCVHGWIRGGVMGKIEDIKAYTWGLRPAILRDDTGDEEGSSKEKENGPEEEGIVRD